MKFTLEDPLDPLDAMATEGPGTSGATAPRCACGKVAYRFCADLWSPTTLIPCYEPLCSASCPRHRHAPGTMGYPMTLRGQTRYSGDEPDDDGFIEWVRSRYRAIFWSAEKKAANVYREVCASFAPPAPWPLLQLQIGRRRFESRGAKGMVEVTDWSRP